MSGIIAEIDTQILKLQQARTLLSEAGAPPAMKARRGRPKGSKNTATKAAVKPVAKTAPAVAPKLKRKLSPEGRKRIAEAMKKRWADRKKLAVK